MGIADPARARDVVTEFIGLLEEHKRYSDQFDTMDDIWASATGHTNTAQEPLRRKRDDLNSTIWRRLPLVEAIAKRVDSNFAPESFQEGQGGGLWPWRAALASAHGLAGILERSADEDAILGPAGPTLAAGGMHPWVWNAVLNLWDDGHYKHAVNAAAAAVEQQTQLKLDRGDLNGADLYTQAFKVDGPGTQPDGRRLRFAYLPELTSAGDRHRSWVSAHEGAMHFGRGCAQAIRNLSTHGTVELSEQVALEHLASFSVLARWVDDAVVFEPTQQSQTADP